MSHSQSQIQMVSRLVATAQIHKLMEYETATGGGAPIKQGPSSSTSIADMKMIHMRISSKGRFLYSFGTKL